MRILIADPPEVMRDEDLEIMSSRYFIQSSILDNNKGDEN